MQKTFLMLFHTFKNFKLKQPMKTFLFIFHNIFSSFLEQCTKNKTKPTVDVVKLSLPKQIRSDFTKY